MVKTKNIENVQLSLLFTVKIFSDFLFTVKTFWISYLLLKSFRISYLLLKTFSDILENL